jgi:hypothetical protein
MRLKLLKVGAIHELLLLLVILDLPKFFQINLADICPQLNF